MDKQVELDNKDEVENKEIISKEEKGKIDIMNDEEPISNEELIDNEDGIDNHDKIDKQQITNDDKNGKKNFKKEIISWIKIIALALILAWGINHFVIVNATIPSESMEDTIMVGDRIYAFRLAYLFEEPKRGDIIVFPFPDNEKETYIKRIIGLPGETVEGIDGLVYVDGKPLEESYTKDQIQEDFGPFTVPEDSYFMMGDYRSVSADSRFWQHPFVKKDKILGKAVLKYYPNIEFIK